MRKHDERIAFVIVAASVLWVMGCGAGATSPTRSVEQQSLDQEQPQPQPEPPPPSSVVAESDDERARQVLGLAVDLDAPERITLSEVGADEEDERIVALFEQMVAVEELDGGVSVARSIDPEALAELLDTDGVRDDELPGSGRRRPHRPSSTTSSSTTSSSTTTTTTSDRANGHILCMLHGNGAIPPPDSPIWQQDVAPANMHSDPGSQVYQALQLAVALQRCRGAPCDGPSFRLNTQFPFSISYDDSGTNGTFRLSPGPFLNDVRRAHIATGTEAYSAFITGAVAHEVGHWYAARGSRHPITRLRALHPTLFLSNDPAGWADEIFADWFAGRILAAARLPDAPLADFLKAVQSDDPAHPPAARRAHAIELGVSDATGEMVAQNLRTAMENQ